jgi:hypothetical protein
VEIAPYATPAWYRSRSLRQHVIPLPQPISEGKYSHGNPVLSTNKMPVNAARSGTRRRPPFGFGGSAGISSAFNVQSSSVTSTFAMAASS